MSLVFKFFESEIQISDKRERYNSLRLVFVNLADRLSKEFVEIYKKENRNLDDVSRNAYAQGSDCISVAMNFAMESLIKFEIYDIDLEVFINDYYLEYHVWDDHFNEVNDRYMEIALNEEQLDSYRRARREGRGRLIGGGFGLQGAMKGIATAGAVNLAAGAVHGIFNGIGKMISSISAQGKKDKVFRDQATLLTLSSGVYWAVFNIHYALIDVVENYMDSDSYEYVLDDESEKAQRIFQNINTHEIVEAKEKNLLKEIIELNPYNIEFYRYIISKYGDEHGEIGKLAQYFGLDVNNFKRGFLVSYFKNLDVSTEKAALLTKDQLLIKAALLGIKPGDLLSTIEKILLDFDEKARTFEGVLLETREAVAIARKAKSELDQMIKGYERLNENELITLKENISNFPLTIEYQLTDAYTKKIDDRLSNIDTKAKTFDGVTYSTREEALLARNEKKHLTELCVDLESKDENSLVILKEKILKSEYKTQVAMHFITQIDAILNQYIEKRNIEKIQVIYNSINQNSIHEIEMGLKEISATVSNSHGKTQFIEPLKKRYNELVSARQAIIKEKLGLALKYEEKRKRGCLATIFLYIIGIVVSLLLIGWLNIIGLILVALGYLGHFVNVAEMRKCKKAWKELTDNGKQPLPKNV